MHHMWSGIKSVGLYWKYFTLARKVGLGKNIQVCFYLRYAESKVCSKIYLELKPVSTGIYVSSFDGDNFIFYARKK